MAQIFPEFKTEAEAAVIQFNNPKASQFYLDVSTDAPIIQQELSGIVTLADRRNGDKKYWATASISWAHQLHDRNDPILWDGEPIELATATEKDRLASLFNAEWVESDGEFLHVRAVIEYRPQQATNNRGEIVANPQTK